MGDTGKEAVAITKVRAKFRCQECGYESAGWLGRCPGCEAWNTMAEEAVAPPTRDTAAGEAAAAPMPIGDIPADAGQRMASGFGEFDRVLGGGLVPGSF